MLGIFFIIANMKDGANMKRKHMYKCNRKKGDTMATASFNKEIIISEPQAIRKFINILVREDKGIKIDREKASEQSVTRGEDLLKKYLSR